MLNIHFTINLHSNAPDFKKSNRDVDCFEKVMKLNDSPTFTPMQTLVKGSLLNPENFASCPCNPSFNANAWLYTELVVQCDDSYLKVF